MSSKPATPAASRAGAPRVLVYVSDPRQLEPGAAAAPPPAEPCRDLRHLLPANTLYRTQLQQTDQRNSPNTVYYKSLHNDAKLTPYGAGDASLQRTDFFPVGQQFPREPSIKLEEKSVDRQASLALRRDCSSNSINPECHLETYNTRIPIETGELATYQNRCIGALNSDDSGQSMQPIVVQQGFNQFIESGTVQSVGSDGRNGIDRELVDKSYVNYQFLEQSVSHQSIVNQSINILNQQVGVSTGLSEGEGQQLVLAVLPPGSAQPVDSSEQRRTTQSEASQTITVPLGWRRIVNGTSVLYISPSGTALSTLPQLREYLQTSGTCKCGLPCPLRPETTFSFDSKVASKPYQAASGAELNKLCNHKRKLLATLQARAQSPSTPPPQAEQKKGQGSELSVLKKKMKKRPSFPPNMSGPQLMQRERPLNEYKTQDNEQCQTVSPETAAPTNGQSIPFSLQQNMPNPVPLDSDVKQETQVQRSSHYLTVNSGWIMQQETGQKQNQPSNGPNMHNPINVGMPVVGTNGQIIGVNTGYNKHTNFKNVTGMMSQNVVESEPKEEKKDPVPSPAKPAAKEDESQIFCGLNQPLTPEVMQKINEQQQLFIQQNQKQIEMAMKGYRTQLAESVNQNKCQGQSQFAPQGQLVIQNGAVVKSNPAKTPPWQVKRSDAGPQPSALDTSDYDDSHPNISDDTSSIQNSFVNNEHTMNRAMCPRVPPLPQHYNLMGQQWPVAEINKKKVKNNNKGSKKKNNVTENRMMNYNNGMRLVQESKGKSCDDMTSDSVPSFMDDPNGYLAQQTVLLNNTISRQVGINSSFDGSQYDNSINCYGGNNHQEKSSKPMNKSCDTSNVFRSNMVSNPSPSPNNTPDSSVLSDRGPENSQCCKGCNVSYKGGNAEFSESQMRMKYMKHNMYKMESERSRHDGSLAPSPSRSFDDSPVTSSTLLERSPSREGGGALQAGAGSGSDAPPAEPEPGPPAAHSAHSAHSVTGTQMMHFISNHNVNKNLMEVDNISMVGVTPGLRLPRDVYGSEPRKRTDHPMPGYCPPPHLGGGPAHSPVRSCYVQSYVTTMASGFSVTRDTVTSVLAGKASTATTSINASRANFARPPPPPAAAYAIPNNQPDPFINSVNLPTSYPLHIAGTTAQNMISKSPLEMVQNVIGNSPAKPENGNALATAVPQMNRRSCPPTTPGQILISSTGQIIVSNNQMPPPPPKASTATPPPQGPPAVVVNAVQAPFVLQPSMMAMDGQVVQQNAMLPQIVTGGLVPGQSPNESPRHIDVKSGPNFIQGVAMLSPESLKKRNKKKKSPNTSITNVLQIAAPQPNPNNIMVHHTSPQHNTSPQFSPRGFQLSPNNNISPGPMLQALTIVPGKSGTPAHIVMNGQSNANNFGSQQIIANTSPSQQINLLQPVNLINNASGVMPNFQAFQQFIVPNLGGMVMTADGAILQDAAGGVPVPVQLQLQAVHGQSVLAPVQGAGVFAAGANGVVIRQNQGKMVQSQHSPGAQFLSPGGQVVVNGAGFGGQLSPLLAGLSPTGVAFPGAPHARPAGVPAQEFLQANRTLMVPLSPKRAPASRANSTFVRQNTTIVQQQTTLVSNAHGAHSLTASLQGNSRLSVDPHASAHKVSSPEERRAEAAASPGAGHVHSVSTQTLLSRKSPAGCSAPDTTTLSPRAEPAASPRRRADLADTTTDSPEPADASSSAMVQCVSSSEQDMAESREHAWPAPRADFAPETDAQGVMSNLPLMRQNRNHNSVESTEMHYIQNMTPQPASNQNLMPVNSNYYERTQTYKRKNDFGDGSTYRTDKMMRSSYGMVHGLPKDDYDNVAVSADKSQTRHFPPSETSSDSSAIQKVFDRHNLGAGNEAAGGGREFSAGELVWGPVAGHASWPGKLARRAADGRWEVRWFGRRAPARLPAARLLALSDGLDAHHAAGTRHRKSRKLNTELENAIQEAMAELDKKSEAAAPAARRTRSRRGPRARAERRRSAR